MTLNCFLMLFFPPEFSCMCLQVNAIKSDLSSLGDGVEEFRAVCRQLHSRIRNLPDCPAAPFESEADALMDCWLDVGPSFSKLRVLITLLKMALLFGMTHREAIWALFKDLFISMISSGEREDRLLF